VTPAVRVIAITDLPRSATRGYSGAGDIRAIHGSSKKIRFSHNLLPNFMQYVTEQCDLTLQRFNVTKPKWSYRSWLTGYCKETRDRRNSFP
jgi:hypothetical protein